MSKPLSDSEICGIASILSEDFQARENKSQIYGSLGLPFAELKDLIKNNGYEFFSTTLQKYRSIRGSKATLFTLIKQFTELKLVDVVEKIKGAHSRGRIFFDVQCPVDLFTGRTRKLNKLHNLLTQQAGIEAFTRRIAIVTGLLGGVGKSELVRKYAWKYYNNGHYADVIWINAETGNSVGYSFAKLLKDKFNYVEDDLHNMTNEDMVKVVYPILKANLNESKSKCLLIFDNVKEFDVIQLMRDCMTPGFTSVIQSIILTSQKTYFSKHDGMQFLSLNCLTIKKAIKLVRKKGINGESTEQVLTLVKTLQCLPLAIQQAVAYMREELGDNPSPIKRYLEKYEVQSKALLDFKLEEKNMNVKTTFTTLNLTMDTLITKKFGSLAGRIMSLISIFEANNIPTSVFSKLEKNTEATTDETPEDKVNCAIGLLKLYSLINGPAGTIQVHRLVQMVQRLNMNQTQLSEVISDSLGLLQPYMDKDSKNSELTQVLMQHAQSVWKYSLKSGITDVINKFASFPTHVCEKLDNYGRFEASLQLAQDSYKVVKQLRPKHKETTRIRLKESRALYRLKRYHESLNLLDELYIQAKKQLGVENKLTLQIYSWLAKNYGQLGQGEKGIKILERILQVRLKTLDPGHQTVVSTMHDTGIVYFHLGNYDESYSAFKCAYKGRKKKHGSKDSRTLNSKRWMGDVLKKQGKRKESRKIYKSVYRARKQTLGEDHPYVLLTEDSLNLIDKL